MRHPVLSKIAVLLQERDSIRASHPGARPSDISAIAGRKWKELDPDEKQLLVAAAKTKREEWKKAMKEAMESAKSLQADPGEKQRRLDIKTPRKSTRKPV